MLGTLGHFVAVLRVDFVEFARTKMDKIGVSRGILYFLLYIAKNPGCTAGELAAGLHADAGYATRAVDKLVRGGFVERCPKKQDKRAVALHLTTQGVEAFETARDLFAQWDKKIMEQLPQEQQAALLQTMEQLSRNITAQEKRIAATDI